MCLHIIASYALTRINTPCEHRLTTTADMILLPKALLF